MLSKNLEKIASASEIKKGDFVILNLKYYEHVTTKEGEIVRRICSSVGKPIKAIIFADRIEKIENCEVGGIVFYNNQEKKRLELSIYDNKIADKIYSPPPNSNYPNTEPTIIPYPWIKEIFRIVRNNPI